MGSSAIAGLGSLERGDRSISLVPYSIFTKTQKRWIVCQIALIGMLSPLSSFIYYPAIDALAKDLNTSVELINLTVTSYMVVSGIAPALLGNMADTVGRRSAYIFALLIYLVANIGLAVQTLYPALLVLRMLQSMGSSGTSQSSHVLSPTF